MISFCIITDGKEPDKLEAELDSIHALNMPEYEIVVAGNPQVGISADVIVPMPHTARQGRLGAMRNAAVHYSTGDVIVVADDDMIFQHDFHEGLESMSGDWDLMSCKILNPDGTRYWDWKAHYAGKNWLLEYDEEHEYQSLTGGLTIMKRHVWERVQWDDELGFNQAEDVDFTSRAKAAGYRIVFNPRSTIIHDAPYTQIGLGVLKIKE